MKNRTSLIATIWVIAVGIILWIVGSQIGGMFAAQTTMNYVGFGIMWAGIVLLILGVFGVITTAIMEYLDTSKKQTP